MSDPTLEPTTVKKRKSHLVYFSILVFLVLAGAAIFVYAVIPNRVARAITEIARVHKPLTQTPTDYGMENYQDVSFTTDDRLTISGWWIPVEPKKKTLGTVLLTHGVFKNREQVLDRATLLVKSGYQVLLFDQRGCGKSGECALSGGVMEYQDFLSALSYLEDKKLVQKPVVFFGFSMGAMSALRAAAQSTEVEGVIADSPLANLKSYVSRRTVGGFCTSLPGFLDSCLGAYNRVTGLSLTREELDLIPVVGRLHDLPVLYITGEQDDLARPEEVKTLFEKSASKRKRLIYIAEAGHEETFEKRPLVYRRAVIDFLADLAKAPAAKVK